MPEKPFCYPFGIIGNLCNFTLILCFNVFLNILIVLMHNQTLLQNQLILSWIIQMSCLPN